MKSNQGPVEIMYVRGGVSRAANFSVDPNENQEEARAEAIRNSRNRRSEARKKRRRMEKRAGVAVEETSEGEL